MQPLEGIIGYDCKGKRNVISLWRKIKSNIKYKSVISCFFVDKDYGVNPEKYDKSVYETPSYSIENFYVTLDAMKNILVKEFGINAIDSDYSKTLQDYDERLNEYRNILAGLNTFIICFQKLSASLKLDKFKLDDFVHIDIREIKVLKEMSFKNLNDYYLKKLNNECKQGRKYSEENLKNYLEVIDSVESMFMKEFEVVNNNLENLSHGKFELHFFKKVLGNLKTLNDKKDYFSLKRESISLDTNSKNLLSILSKYAYTPKCLKEFLNIYQSTDTGILSAIK